MPLRAGDDIVIRAMHSDGTVYRWRRAVVEEVRADRVITYAGPGGAILSPTYGRGVARDHVRSTFFIDKMYSLFEFHHVGSRSGADLYFNINKPAQFTAWSISYTDLELDVVKHPGQAARIVDQDEFEAAITHYGYSDALQARVRAAAEEGLRITEAWKAGPVRRDIRVLRAGDVIRARALKHDGRPYRWWRTTLHDIDEKGLVTASQIGNLVRQPRSAWRTRSHIRGFFWFDRPQGVLECYGRTGELDELYVNIGTPVRLRAGKLEYTDYELDVSKRPGEAARIVDEDEFVEAAKRYRYSPALQRGVRAAAREGVKLAESWQPRGWFEDI